MGRCTKLYERHSPTSPCYRSLSEPSRNPSRSSDTQNGLPQELFRRTICQSRHHHGREDQGAGHHRQQLAVFSKSYCPYCKATKSLLSELGAKPYILELDQVDDGADIQDALQEMTKQRSVPNVFINKQHMGGNSDLQAKKSELPQLLKDAKAI